MLPKFKAALFDLDGTLLCSMRYWRFSTLELLLAHDVIPTGEDLSRMYLTSSKRLCAEILEAHGIHMEQAEIVHELEAYMHRHYLCDAHAKPHAEAYLRKLQAEGIRMCVGTGSPREFARDGLRRLGMDKYFFFITDCYEYGLTKSDPAYFAFMAQKLGVETKDMCVFEDALYSIRSAKAAGCPVIALIDPTQVNDHAEIKRTSDHWIQSYAELI